ncbi:MAG: NAD(P)-dependent oxidoreductase [Stomatobaculum sp.]
MGIVGGGNIGRKVAKKVQVFGAKTCYYDAFRLPEALEKTLIWNMFLWMNCLRLRTL